MKKKIKKVKTTTKIYKPGSKEYKEIQKTSSTTAPMIYPY